MKRKPKSNAQTPEYPSFESHHASSNRNAARNGLRAGALLAAAMMIPDANAARMPEIAGDIAVPAPVTKPQPETVKPTPKPVNTNNVPRIRGKIAAPQNPTVNTNTPAVRGRIAMPRPALKGAMPAPKPPAKKPVEKPAEKPAERPSETPATTDKK